MDGGGRQGVAFSQVVRTCHGVPQHTKAGWYDEKLCGQSHPSTSSQRRDGWAPELFSMIHRLRPPHMGRWGDLDSPLSNLRRRLARPRNWSLPDRRGAVSITCDRTLCWVVHSFPHLLYAPCLSSRCRGCRIAPLPTSPNCSKIRHGTKYVSVHWSRCGLSSPTTCICH